MWTVTSPVSSPVLTRVTRERNNPMLLPQSPSSSRLQRHPVSIGRLLSPQACPPASSCLSVSPPLAMGLTALSPRSLERMPHSDFLLHKAHVTWPRSPPPSAPSFSLTALRYAPFLAPRHSRLVSAQGHRCSLCLEFSLLGSLYGQRSLLSNLIWDITSSERPGLKYLPTSCLHSPTHLVTLSQSPPSKFFL